LPAWKRACLTHSLPERLIPRDVRTRRNSTFDMLSFAVKHRKAINDIAAERSLKLRKYELDEQEWKILGDLLMMYKAATLAFSTNSVGTIANVIPTMDKIDALLTLQGDKALHPSVRAAIQFAKNCLNKYWFNAEDSDVYRIAMSK
ncbi:hypothetical protein B0H14DRAFT_3759017, partial [Mycena olivaceomarginata]